MSARLAPSESASLSVTLFNVLRFAERNARIERLKIRELEIIQDEMEDASWMEDEERQLRLWAELRAIRAELGGGL